MAGLRSGRSPTAERGTQRLQKGLVAVQMALCIVLLTGSALFVRSLRNALNTEMGMRSDDVAVMRFNMGVLGYDGPQAETFVSSLHQRLNGLPGVGSAAISTLVPFQGAGFMGTFMDVDGYEPRPDEEMRVDLVFTTRGYFEALGTRISAGRDFTPADAEGSADVAIVTQAMADAYWPNGGAVGGTIRFGEDPIRVVGVAEDIKWSSVDESPTNFAFFPIAQTGASTRQFLTAVVRTEAKPRATLPAMREVVRSLDPDISPILMATMDDLVGGVLMPQRLGAVLLSGFGLLASILAAVGIGGVVSYAVRQQRRAIGVRLALGARGDQVRGLVVRGMFGPIALGLIAGVTIALALRSTVDDFLFGVSPGDPLTYLTVAVALAGAAIVAALIPANEAARLDPVRVLKSE